MMQLSEENSLQVIAHCVQQRQRPMTGEHTLFWSSPGCSGARRPTEARSAQKYHLKDSFSTSGIGLRIQIPALIRSPGALGFRANTILVGKSLLVVSNQGPAFLQDKLTTTREPPRCGHRGAGGPTSRRSPARQPVEASAALCTPSSPLFGQSLGLN